MADDRFSLIQGGGGQHNNKSGTSGEALTETYLALQKRDEGVARPNLKMFGGVVPYSCRADNTLAEKLSLNADSYQRSMDDRLQTAVTVAGVHPCLWRSLNYALRMGYKPFHMLFRKPDSLSWIEIAQKVIPYVGEVFLPAIYPSWMKRLSYSQHMYLAHLKVFWLELPACYSDPWELTLEFDLSGTQRFVNYAVYSHEEGEGAAERRNAMYQRRRDVQDRVFVALMQSDAVKNASQSPEALAAAIEAAKAAGQKANQEINSWWKEE